MSNDDDLIGRLFTRREALSILGGAGYSLLLGCSRSGVNDGTTQSNGSCVVRPALTQGPYFVDERLNRSDIRSDPSDGSVRPGTPLALTVIISRLASGACSPIEGALVDLWHCDALGVYSDVTGPGFDTLGKKYLRGYQITDASGAAKFTTIYPGWYAGRAVHLHFKIRSGVGVSPAYEFTSQWFFSDSLTDTVHAQQPYAAKGTGRLGNSGDGIYRQGGSQLVLDLSSAGPGYTASFNVAMQGV